MNPWRLLSLTEQAVCAQSPVLRKLLTSFSFGTLLFQPTSVLNRIRCNDERLSFALTSLGSISLSALDLNRVQVITQTSNHAR